MSQPTVSSLDGRTRALAARGPTAPPTQPLLDPAGTSGLDAVVSSARWYGALFGAMGLAAAEWLMRRPFGRDGVWPDPSDPLAEPLSFDPTDGG
jgi:hypothetical protein